MNALWTYIRVKGIETVYLDFDKLEAGEADTESNRLAGYLQKEFPFVRIRNVQNQLQGTEKPSKSLARLKLFAKQKRLPEKRSLQ